MIAQAAAAGARLIVLTEMYATGFSMHPDRIAEDEGGPNEQFLLDQAAEHDAWLIASIAQRGSRTAGSATTRCWPARTARCTATPRSTRSATPASTSTTPPATSFLTVDVDGLRVSVFVCYDLRFADEFWALAAEHRPLRRAGQLARAAARALAGAAAGPGDREPGLRGRREPGRARRPPAPRRRHRGHRPDGRDAGRGHRGETVLVAEVSSGTVRVVLSAVSVSGRSSAAVASRGPLRTHQLSRFERVNRWLPVDFG